MGGLNVSSDANDGVDIEDPLYNIGMLGSFEDLAGSLVASGFSNGYNLSNCRIFTTIFRDDIHNVIPEKACQRYCYDELVGKNPDKVTVCRSEGFGQNLKVVSGGVHDFDDVYGIADDETGDTVVMLDDRRLGVALGKDLYVQAALCEMIGHMIQAQISGEGVPLLISGDSEHGMAMIEPELRPVLLDLLSKYPGKIVVLGISGKDGDPQIEIVRVFGHEEGVSKADEICANVGGYPQGIIAITRKEPIEGEVPLFIGYREYQVVAPALRVMC